MVWLTEARAPEGMRLYAIGDVHGCLDALARLHEAIESDLARRPVDDWRIILIGDYVDRGRDSHGVIEYLAGWTASDPHVVCLRGNHDEMFASALAGDRRAAGVWLNNGGLETLASYGIGLEPFLQRLRDGDPTAEVIPAAHRAFLEGLENSVRLGDYYFVHAGIDPDRELAMQQPSAQLWIRETFLDSDREYEAVIVHGHTPVSRVTVRENRIGIDTGAVFGGRLSCLVLEGAGKALLGASGPEPILPPERVDTWADDDDPEPAGSLSRIFSRFARLGGRR